MSLNRGIFPHRFCTRPYPSERLRVLIFGQDLLGERKRNRSFVSSSFHSKCIQEFKNEGISHKNLKDKPRDMNFKGVGLCSDCRVTSLIMLNETACVCRTCPQTLF